MTTLTLAQSGTQAQPRPVPWRRMVWVTWRQQRPTIITVPVLLGAVAIFLSIEGLRIHHDWTTLLACHPFQSAACQALNSHFNSVDWTMGNTLNLLVNLAPALLGAFTGAPLLARELEKGTFRYAWTQGIGRRRWSIAKLALLAMVITGAAAAFSVLFDWFFQPFLAQQPFLTVLSGTVFTTRPVAFAAWTLLAFTVGACAGMLIRRIVPAMAVTLGVYLGLQIVTWLYLRPLYPVSLVTSNSVVANGPNLINSSTSAASGTANLPTVLSRWYTGPGGAPANMSVVNQNLAQHGITEWWRYVPVSRLWPMQFIEAGWLLVLSILLAAGTVWLVRHRAA
jgi:ABC-type transport system involved in multi-copper enzyme maturation permease subunit